MVETSHQIRRDLEHTRERVATTIAALERKVNPRYVVEDNPLTVLGVAFGTGVLLGTTGAAGRAGREIRSQIEHGAESVNSSASSVFDRITQTILGAATTAISAKVMELFDDRAARRLDDRKQRTLSLISSA
jgi:hypothetical protein